MEIFWFSLSWGKWGGKKGKSLSFFIGWAWGVLQLPLLVLLRLFPLTEQKQTLFSIVVFSYSCWEGVGGLSVGILLLWNMVGQEAWAKYLYKHGQQEEVTSQHLHLEVEPQWEVCTPSPLFCMWYCFFLRDVIHHIFNTVSFHFKLPNLCAELLFTVLWASTECASYWKEEHYCSHFLWMEKGLNKWQRTVGGRASVQPERKWNEKVQSGRPLIHHDKWERPRPRGYLIAHGGLCAPARPPSAPTQQ